MILQFPDTNILYLALKNSVIPSSIASRTVHFAEGTEGSIYVEIKNTIPRANLKKLYIMGVRRVKRIPLGYTITEAYCWSQLIPLRKQPKFELSDIRNIIIEINESYYLNMIVQEIMRLGNDDISLVSYISESKNEEIFFLHITRPPYYTLLKFMNPKSLEKFDNIRIYYEQMPRCWVQLGWLHPLAQRFSISEGNSLFIHAPHHWRLFNNMSFKNIYQSLIIQIPDKQNYWQSVLNPPKIQVNLQLVKTNNTADQPSLWMIPEERQLEFEKWLRNQDENSISILDFAIVESESDKRWIILRAPKARASLSVLPEAIAQPYVMHPHLMQLYYPLGFRLKPNVHPETLRSILALDDKHVVCLHHTGENNFYPYIISVDIFESLSNWLEYIISRNHEVLSKWIKATIFDWRSWGPAAGSTHLPPDIDSPIPCVVERTNVASPEEAANDSTEKNDYKYHTILYSNQNQDIKNDAIPDNSQTYMSDEQQEVLSLEKQFQETKSTKLDDNKRLRLWPKLAESYTRCKRFDQAALCWLQAIWHASDNQFGELVEKWFRTEWKNTTTPSIKQWQQIFSDPVTTDEACRRNLATIIYWLIKYPDLHTQDMLNKYYIFIEKYRKLLPYRGIWIACRLLSERLANPLLLSRVTDQLLQAIDRYPLDIIRDLPDFLRFQILRYQKVRQQLEYQLPELLDHVERWIPIYDNKNLQQRPYIYYCFAYLAALVNLNIYKYQWMNCARCLLYDAINSMDKYSNIMQKYASIVDDIYTYRIQSVSNDINTARSIRSAKLPQSIYDEIRYLEDACRRLPNDTDITIRMAGYAVRRLLQKSEILDPFVQINAFIQFENENNKSHTSFAHNVYLVRTELVSLINMTNEERHSTWNDLYVKLINLIDRYHTEKYDYDFKNEDVLYNLEEFAKLYGAALYAAGIYLEDPWLDKIILVLDKHIKLLKDQFADKLYHYVLMSYLIPIAAELKNWYRERRIFDYLVDYLSAFDVQYTQSNRDIYNYMIINIANSVLKVIVDPSKSKPVLDELFMQVLETTEKYSCDTSKCGSIITHYIKTLSSLDNAISFHYVHEYFKTCVDKKIHIPFGLSTRYYYSVVHLQIVESLTYLVDGPQTHWIEDIHHGQRMFFNVLLENERLFRQRVVADASLASQISYNVL